MAKKAVVDTGIDEQDSEQTQPEEKRAQISTKKALVLNIAFNVNRPEVLKKGIIVSTNSPEYYLAVKLLPEALTRLSDTSYELNKEITIQRKKALPVGTVLDPVKDKWIIDRVTRKHFAKAGALKEIDVIEK